MTSCYHFSYDQKLTIGSTAERIVSAFHSVVSEHHGEDEEMNKCKSAVHRVKKMEKDVDLSLTNGKLAMIQKIAFFASSMYGVKLV